MEEGKPRWRTRNANDLIHQPKRTRDFGRGRQE